MWEDPQNRDGGRWVINVNKNSRNVLLDSYWLNTVIIIIISFNSVLSTKFIFQFMLKLLALIGDQFYDDSPYVNGAYINVRTKGDRLSLWTKAARDSDLQHRIGDKFRETLSLRENILQFEVSFLFLFKKI